MQYLAILLVLIFSTIPAAAWKCGDTPCPGNLCVKDPNNGDYCTRGLIVTKGSNGQFMIQFALPEQAKRARDVLKADESK